MRFSLAAFMAAVFFTALPVMADQKQPKIKNKKELEALQKVQAATDPDSQLAAISNVLENFSDTDYKPMLLSMGMRAAQQKDDLGLVTTWTQRTLQEDPNNIEAHVVIAEATARHTRENDLDKADSIKIINTNANQALTLIKAATAAPASIPDAQWPNAKMQLTEDSYEAIGIAAGLEKKYPEEVAAFEAGVAADPNGSVLKVRLAKAYVDVKQYDKAITTADQVLADANAQPVVKQLAQAQKDAATRLKK